MLSYIYIDMLGFADDLDLSALTNDQIKEKKHQFSLKMPQRQGSESIGVGWWINNILYSTAVIDTTSYLGNALNYLGGPDDNQMKNQD